ncbi:MAG: tetratricopeptide repeat protein [Nitrospirae bacterium]|nr:tetratricopeptide repeat protein [Nitrospirota bacterium]
MMARSYAYNTRKKTPDQLERELVGSERWDILNGLLKELALTKGEHPKQHWMIVGPRGIGKSHLLTLLYYKIKNNPDLTKKWITVLFPEELRMANDLAKFLERTVNEILLELEKEQSPVTEELQQEIKKIRGIRASERIEHLFTVLNWIHRSSGKYILLLFENLQKLLGEKISIIEQKKLRAFLQTHDNVLLVGSATTVFNALHDNKHPFYNFFHIRRLTDLNFDEMKILITNILTDDNRQDIVGKVAKTEARMRALYSFTGGNPRMAVFLSDILKTEVPDEMLDFMDEILEDLTPYFEAILNDTPDYMEEVMNTLAMHEPAQSPKEIADHLEMPQATIRNYLKQMKENGYVRIAFSKGKSNYYCLNEYLYRIWYQMRDSSHREETRWLMELLMMLYSPKAIMDEKSKLDKCNMEEITADSYKKLIFKTADFMDRHPEYCKVIELCVDSALPDKKEKTGDEIEKKLFKKAREYRKNREYDKAIDEYRKILELNPKSTKAYWYWGDCLRKMKQFKNAIEKFKKVVEIDPNIATAYGAWGECLRNLGQYKEADEKYTKALDINSEYIDAYFAWGKSLRKQKRYDEAVEKYKMALKINPKSEGAYVSWGDCLAEQQQYDKAIGKYKKALEINPKLEHAYGLWGECLREQKLYDDAIEKYKMALKINPNSENAIKCWLYCFVESKRYQQAVEFIEKHNNALKNCAVVFAYGKSLFKVGRYAEALKQFERLLELHYNCQKVFLLYGKTLYKLSDRENSLLAYTKHIGISSVKLHIDPEFYTTYNQYMLPILETLKPEDYVKQFYALESTKFSKPQLGIFLILLDKYDIVSEHFKSIASEYIEKEDRERFDFWFLVFAIQLSMWLKLTEDKLHEALRLIELYVEYIKLLKTDKEKEEEVSKLILSLFKLQVHMNVKNENIHQILEQLKNTGIPFSDLFFKLWTCLSDPESIDAQRYLSDKAIAELVEQVKKKDEPTDSECGI